jgi:hypothetical protein
MKATSSHAIFIIEKVFGICISGGKINGQIPSILGNTHIFLKIRGAFPVILSKSLDFALF